MGNVPSKVSGPVSSGTTPTSAASTRPGSPEVHSGRPSLSLHTRPPYTEKSPSSMTDSGHGSSSPTTSQSGHSLLLDHHHPPVPPKDPHYHVQQQNSKASPAMVALPPGKDHRRQKSSRRGNATTTVTAQTQHQSNNKALPESPTPGSRAHEGAHSPANLLTTWTRAPPVNSTANGVVLFDKELPEIQHHQRAVVGDADGDSDADHDNNNNNSADGGDDDGDDDGDGKHTDKGSPQRSLIRTLSGSSTRRMKHDSHTTITTTSVSSSSSSSSSTSSRSNTTDMTTTIVHINNSNSSPPHSLPIPRQGQQHRAVDCTSSKDNNDAADDEVDEPRPPSTRVGLSSSLPSTSLLNSHHLNHQATHHHHGQQQRAATTAFAVATAAAATAGRASLDGGLALRRFATGEMLLSEQQNRSHSGNSTSLFSSASKRPLSWLDRHYSFRRRSNHYYRNSNNSSNGSQDLSSTFVGDSSNNTNSNNRGGEQQPSRSKNNPNTSRSTSVVSSQSGRSSTGSSAFRFSKPNLSFMPLYNHNNESKRQSASATLLQGAGINSNNEQSAGQQQHQQPASPFPEELLSMRLPQSLLEKYTMDTESFRQGKGFWGIGKYSWTITVQARSNGKKYVIKRVAKSLLPPEAYYRYPTTAHRLCTCPACKSRREQLLQSGQIDPKDVEEVLALQYSNNSNNGGGNNLITNVNGNGRGHRRDQSLLTRLSQPSSPSASSSNLNLLGLGGIKATTLLTNKEKKRNSGGGGSANGGSILPLQRASTMSPSRFFGSASGYKSGSSTPQGTPIHSRPATPMMTPLSRPGTPSASATLSNAHKSSHTGHNTPNHPNNNNNNNNNNSGSTLVVNTSTPNIQLSQTNHDQGDVAEVKHSRSKSHATPSSSLRLGSSSASHRPPALNLFTRTPSQDKVAQTINTSSSLLSPVSPYHSKSFAQELENSIPIPLRGAEQRSQLSSPPPSQRASLENPSDSSLKSLQHKGLESVQAGRLLEMRASVSTTAIHTSEGAGENGGKEVSEVEPSNPVLLPSLVLDTDRQPSHSHHLSTVSSSFSPSRIERGPPGLKKKEGASRPGLRRVASTPSLSRARTGLDALDEDPLVVQLRAATHYPLSKPSARTTSYNDSWRQNGIPKVQVTPSEEKSSFSLSSRGSHGRVFGQDDGDALDKNTRDSGIEDDRIFKLDDDHYDDEQRHQQHHPSLRKIIHFQHGAEEEDSEEDDSADEAWIAPGRAQEEYPSPVRSLTPSAAVNAAAAAAALAGLSLPPSTSIAIQQPNYVPPPHSLPMELVLLQTYNDSDHLPEHHEWTQDQDYWYYVTKAHGVKRPKLKKISSWWTDAIGGSLIAATGGGNGNTGGSGGAGGGGSGIGPRPLLTPPPSSSSSSSHGLSTTTESMAIGPVFHMSMSPVSFAGASSATGGQKHLDHHGSSAHTTTNTSLTNGQEDRTSNDGQNNSSSSGDSSSNSNSNSNNSSKSSSNNTLAVPGQGGGERFLNVHGLASDVSLISLDSNGYVYNNYSSTPNNKSNMPWTKRHGSPRQYHSSKYYYVDWDEYISL